MFSPVELKKGSVYLLQSDFALTPSQKGNLEKSLRQIADKNGVEFVVFDGGLKLACSVDLKGLSFEEIKEVIGLAKC